MNIWIILALIVGFLIREVAAIMARSNDKAPSLAYYWSQPKNRWMLALNALCTIGLALGRPELLRICASEAFAQAWPTLAGFGAVLSAAPILSALGTGLFGGIAIRWLITLVDTRAKAKRANQPPPDVQ